jgi:hypothetical protein
MLCVVIRRTAQWRQLCWWLTPVAVAEAEKLAGESVSRILSLRRLVPTCVEIFDDAAR